MLYAFLLTFLKSSKKAQIAPFLIPPLFFVLYALCFPFDIPKIIKKGANCAFFDSTFILCALCSML
jgi:hypothetical protein